MLKVTCKRCGASATVAASGEADTVALPGCHCCPLGHDHGLAANLTGTPCRPVHIEAPPGFMTVTAAGAA